MFRCARGIDLSQRIADKPAIRLGDGAPLRDTEFRRPYVEIHLCLCVSSEGFVGTLRRVPLFNELSEVELESIARSLSVGRYEAGNLVFTEGEEGGDLLIVMQGSIRVVKVAANGRHQLLAIERIGASLGEVSVFDGSSYSTTAIAIESSALLRLRGEDFRHLCFAHPGVAVKVIKVLGHRLRQTGDWWKNSLLRLSATD
jgi:CRP-like cAMP-binding protein